MHSLVPVLAGRRHLGIAAALVVAIAAPAATAYDVPSRPEDAATTQFDALIRAVVSEGEEGPGFRSAVDAFVAQSPTRWRTAIESRIAASPTPEVSHAALAVLAHAGMAVDLTLAVRAAGSTGNEHGFEHALTAILLRDHSAFASIDGVSRAAPKELGPSFVQALADTHSVEGARALSRWIDHEPDLAQVALARLGRMGLDLPHPLPDDILAPVRNVVLGESEYLTDAIICAGRLEDYDAIPSLVRLLSSARKGVRADSLWALQKITGLGLRETPERWSDWLRIETEWWEHESKPLFEALAKKDRPAKIHALDEIARIHLWRHRLARDTVVAVSDPDVDVACLAITVLERLGSSTVVPALVAALSRPEPKVSSAAWRALKALTKRDLPLDVAAWREVVAHRE